MTRESRPAAEDGSNSMSGDPDMELRMEQSLTALAAESRDGPSPRNQPLDPPP